MRIWKLLKQLVGARGFEPPTPWSRTRCSTRLSHAPLLRERNCFLEKRCWPTCHRFGQIVVRPIRSQRRQRDIAFGHCNIIRRGIFFGFWQMQVLIQPEVLPSTRIRVFYNQIANISTALKGDSYPFDGSGRHIDVQNRTVW